jgi:hypothetical protein
MAGGCNCVAGIIDVYSKFSKKEGDIGDSTRLGGVSKPEVS